MGYRLFHLKVVPDAYPNAEGRWVARVVPDVWPGDDLAQSHMLKEEPDYDTVPGPGLHVVAIQEVEPGPSDQPGTMWEGAGFPNGNFDDVTYGRRP
jgi:hypothetical protein